MSSSSKANQRTSSLMPSIFQLLAHRAAVESTFCDDKSGEPDRLGTVSRNLGEVLTVAIDIFNLYCDL
ncbi:hypothetical protein OUZ56_008049 [Daphnia magna]|uniref:Uncharacterized protein n=1 Tax=Daphnia magna TaxID=35525 RepID=A0ABR0ABT2_9CRUS|nr:hypothetical protein OUZ56_008049 [Daphnia magna]